MLKKSRLGRGMGDKARKRTAGKRKRSDKNSVRVELTQRDREIVTAAVAAEKRVKKLDEMFKDSFIRNSLENPETNLEELWSRTLTNVLKAQRAHASATMQGTDKKLLERFLLTDFERMLANAKLFRNYYMKQATAERRFERLRKNQFQKNMERLGLTEINQQRAARESYNEITGWLRLKEGNPVEKDLVGEVARISQVKYDLPIEDAVKITDLFFETSGGHHVLRPEFEQLRAGKPPPRELIPKRRPKRR